MAIHDTDLRDDYDRLNPTTNTPDHLTVDSNGVLSMQAKSTDSIAHRAEGSVIGVGKTITKNDRTVVYDASNSRIIFGLLPDGTYGIVISKAGTDVLSLF